MGWEKQKNPEIKDTYTKKPPEDGDLVVVSGRGTDMPPMYGIFNKEKNSVKCLAPNGSVTYRNGEWVCRIEGEGGEIHGRILAAIKAFEEAEAARKVAVNKQRATQKANEVGKVYVFPKDSTRYLYCGKCRVTTTSTYEPGKVEVTEGYLYLSGGEPDWCEDSTAWDFNHFLNYLREEFNIDADDKHARTIKSVKNYTESQQVIEVPEEFTIVAYSWKYRYEQVITRL